MTRHADAPARADAQWKQKLPELAAENMLLIGRLKTGNLVFRRRFYQIFTGSKGVLTEQYVLQQLITRQNNPFFIGQLKKAQQRLILSCNVSKL